MSGPKHLAQNVWPRVSGSEHLARYPVQDTLARSILRPGAVFTCHPCCRCGAGVHFRARQSKYRFGWHCAPGQRHCVHSVRQ